MRSCTARRCAHCVRVRIQLPAHQYMAHVASKRNLYDDEDDDATPSGHKVNPTGDSVIKSPGACRLCEWRPRRARSLWAIGATRTRPLQAANELPLAQVGHFQRNVVHPSGRSKNGSQCTCLGRNWSSRVCLTAHQKEEKLTARTVLGGVELLSGCAHVQNFGNAHVRPQCIPERCPPASPLAEKLLRCSTCFFARAQLHLSAFAVGRSAGIEVAVLWSPATASTSP